MMPKTQDILDGLQSIVNKYILFAIIWHVFYYILIAFLLTTWKPSNQAMAILLCAPILSVAVFSWLGRNPFNGTFFSLLTLLLIIFGIGSSLQPVSLSTWPFMTAGIIMIVFGLVYPHFLDTHRVIRYLYASPAGLIPCPTLSILIGFVLLFNGLGSHAFTLTCILFGLFYGVFGVLKLAVRMDLLLVFGALVLMVRYILVLF